MIYHENTKQKKAGIAILISDKVDFRTRNITRDTERHSIIIKEPILHEHITFKNMYVSNNRASNI